MGTDLVPFFSSDNGEEADVAGMLRAWDRAELASRTLKAGILLVAAGAIVLAVVSAGNPLVLFSKARASLIGASADDAGQPAPIIQSTADGQVSPPNAPDATEEPKGDDTAFVREAADQSQTEIRQQPAEDVLKQLQAWAAEKDAREKAAPVPSVEPVEAAAPVQPAEPVQAAQETRTPVTQQPEPKVRHAQRRRLIRPVQNARAEIRPAQNIRPRVGLAKNTGADIRRTTPIRASQPPRDPEDSPASRTMLPGKP
jgi:hypothetical protein